MSKINNVISIEFTESEIKAAQIKRVKNTLVVQNLANEVLPKDEETGEIAKALAAAKIQEMLKAKGMSSGYVNFVIPKNFVTVHLVNLPSNDAAEISRMVQFEARRHIPFNPDRHIVAHHVLSSDPAEGSEVIFAAIDEPIISSYIQIAEKAGLTVRSAYPSSACSYNTVAVKDKDILADKSAVVMNMGWTATDITIVRNGIALYMRSAPVGGKNLLESLGVDVEGFSSAMKRKELASYDLLSAEHVPFEKDAEEFRKILGDWINKVIFQLRQTYSFAQREYNCPPAEKIIIGGEMAALQGIGDLLKKSIEVDVVKTDSFNKLSIDDKKLNAEDRLSAFNNVIGASIVETSRDGLKLNLLPKTYQDKTATGERMKSLLVTTSLLLVVVIMGIMFLSQRNSTRQELITFYEEQIRKMQPVVDDIQDKEEKLGIIEGYIKDQNSAIAILNDLEKYSSFRNRMSLREFSYVKDESITLLGWSASFSEITRFKNYLEELPYFEKVKIKDRPPDDLNRHKVFRFEIECILKKSL